MKSLVITPKDNNELKFVADLLKKLGVNAAAIDREELEDIALAALMKKEATGKLVSEAEVMKALGQ